MGIYKRKMLRICHDGKCGNCACCLNQSHCIVPKFPTPASHRLALCSPKNINAAGARRVARPVGYCVRGNTAKRARLDLATERVAAFIKLIKLCDTAPWANIQFEINDGMLRVLTATHLHLIVGKSEYKTCNKLKLLRLIDPSRQLDGLSNLVWVTNRQQGKTTTLGKFIACLMISSPEGGDLCNVYATSQDRAQELTKQARTYINFVKAQPGYTHLKTVKQNATTYILHNGLAENIMVSRPKNADSCRGDAPAACFFDEVGFIGEAFWYKFALPLLQVSLRVATCTTTPPPKNGYFDVFLDQIKKRNKQGDMFFYLENHSLSCQACIDNGEADRCCHCLNFVPPWKSLLRLTAMRKLVPKKQIATLQTEVYGILNHGSNAYFPKSLVDAALSRAPTTIPSTFSGPVWVGIDPAGHSVSDMGIVAVVFHNGMAIIVGCASCNLARSDVAGTLALLSVFLRRLRAIIKEPCPFVPIVEVNHSEVLAHTIVKAFEEHGSVYMPFTKERFKSCVLDGIGVRKTRENTLAMVQHTYQSLVEGRLVRSSSVAHCCKADTTPKTLAIPPQDHIEELGNQLKRMQDDDKGEVSGKTAGGENDDMAVALMMTLYWSLCAKAVDPAINL